MAQARYVSEEFNWTADAAYSAGDVVVLGDDLVGVVAADVASGKKVGLRGIGPIFEVVKTNENFSSAYAPIYWDDDANPYGGTAGSGAASLVDYSGPFMGWILETAGTTDGKVLAVLRSAPPGSGS